MTCVISFIRDQGIINAKSVLDVIPTALVEIPDNELGVTYSFKKLELKTLVESIDFINDKFNGEIDKAKDRLSDLRRLSRLKPVMPNIHDKIRAIEAHINNWESIYRENEKAVSFVRNWGVTEAKSLLERLYKLGCPDDMRFSVINGMWQRTSNGFTFQEVKDVVDSVEIIGYLGGMEKLRPSFVQTDKHLGYTHILKKENGIFQFLDDFCDPIPEKAISIKRVKQAIVDFENFNKENNNEMDA
ncbi:hypothetical protein [Acinetobacter venetianus]|uniref:hypothetical protein n=1 Tax=Acinetobacter venetianus TaxID=52133 RepID=UPI003A949D5F